MSILDDVQSLAHAAQVATHGRIVRIERVGTPTLFRDDVPAVVGQSLRKSESADGVTSHVVSRDYLIEPVDYQLGGQPVAPERGDVIVEVDVENGQSVTRRHAVFDLAAEPAVRRTGPTRRRWRLHTKQVSGGA